MMVRMCSLKVAGRWTIPSQAEGRIAQNVYEYHNGQASLISDGKDTSERGASRAVELPGSSASGADVFFTTADRLVPQDTDTQRDIYDAHICSTAEPCITPSATSAPCEEEGCHNPNGEALISENEPQNDQQHTVTKNAKNESDARASLSFLKHKELR
jgi:hypothetical protein